MRALANILDEIEFPESVKAADVLADACEAILRTPEGQSLMQVLFALVKPTQNPFVTTGNDQEAACQARLGELVMLLFSHNPTPTQPHGQTNKRGNRRAKSSGSIADIINA